MINSDHGRAPNGRFANGNSGGPGRPRRAVERDYLAVISQTCPPEVWQMVVDRAVQDAQAGDARAREWLTRYVIGSQPASLLELSVWDQRGYTADEQVRQLHAKQDHAAAYQARLDATRHKPR